MTFSLAELPLPVRLRPAARMSDDALLRFCAANENLRIEREANGELIGMTPAGAKTGRRNAYLIQSLSNWSDGDGRGYAFDSNTGCTLPDGSMRSPDAAWIEGARWDALSEEDKDRFSPISPDFMIELRSLSDDPEELEAKLDQWITNGVPVGR